MKGLDSKIIMSTCEGRPCWVKGRRAIFHRWSDSARPVNPYGKDDPSDERLQKWSVHGIVEYEDGTVEREWPSAIRFADSRKYFDGMAWEQKDGPLQPYEPDADFEINAMCHNCANEPQDIAPCIAADYDCENKCEAICVCRTCFDNSNWKPKEEDQEPAPEINWTCETCAHDVENKEFCEIAANDCGACTVRGCYCKRCKDFNKWEPKGD